MALNSIASTSRNDGDVTADTSADEYSVFKPITKLEVRLKRLKFFAAMNFIT